MELLAKGNNSKGDLFGRLVCDVFLTLGYEAPSLNIHKTGREIDVKAKHRVEPRTAVAECKAHKKAIGGADLNKFAGVLQGERAGSDRPIQGYVLSLGGFTQSALAQEEEFGESRFVLMDAADLEAHLAKGGMVVTEQAACEASGRQAASHGDLKIVDDSPRLLGHELGWIWRCDYESSHETTHFSLIHADGQALASDLADEIIALDRQLGGNLHELVYLEPESTGNERNLAEAQERYRKYLLNELDVITLEGMPADEEVGARRITLEDLYVPLRLEPYDQRSGLEDPDLREIPPDDSPDIDDDDDDSTESVGAVLASRRRIVVLADPGAGKSTLTKRLAVAYLGDEFRAQIADELPEFDALPLFIRCRSLGGNSRASIKEILSDLPRQGEFPECAEGFVALVERALAGGNVLLLVDGLDEISDEGDRAAFLSQLRTFLATYPQVSVVLTSREAGFRDVGAAITVMCESYRIADLRDQDIQQLVLRWHETVVGRTMEIVADAQQLAETIVGTDRVRKLARNPLLLTTLLLVKRWVGDLPRKRSILYEKAIEVLLMTWNVQAHDPIELEEAIPQLSFVAHALTIKGSQRVGLRELDDLLTSAREQMPEILGFARTTVSTFIRQIENRSSLLIMTGHQDEGGRLEPVYEFRHLTFQEYLTALSLVEGYYLGQSDSDRVVGVVESHLYEPRWFEVLSLVNVLAGRSAKEIVSMLLARASGAPGEDDEVWVKGLLARALADEVQMPPSVVSDVSLCVGRNGRHRDEGILREILMGRYGGAFTKDVTEAFFDEADPAHRDFGSAFADIVIIKNAPIAFGNGTLTSWITASLAGDDQVQAAEAALCVMRLAFSKTRKPLEGANESESHLMEAWASKLCDSLERGGPSLRFAATWALAWVGEGGWITTADRPRGLRSLFQLWKAEESEEASRLAAWAFAAMPEIDKELLPLGNADQEIIDFVETEIAVEPDTFNREDRAPAALVLAYYTGVPWSDERFKEEAARLNQTWGRIIPRLVKGHGSA